MNFKKLVYLILFFAQTASINHLWADIPKKVGKWAKTDKDLRYEGTHFGYSVSISKNNVLASGPLNGGLLKNYTINNNLLKTEASFAFPAGTSGDYGTATALNDQINAVSAPYRSPKAMIFLPDGELSLAYRDCGIALSAAKSFLFVGCPVNEKTRGIEHTPRVIFYKKQLNTLSNVKEIIFPDSDSFAGGTLASDQDTLVIGAKQLKNYQTDGTELNNSGAAYVYQNMGSDGWKIKATLKATTPQANAYFGSAIAIFDDLIVVGAPREENQGLTQAGAAYIFKRESDGSWGFFQRITSATPQTYGVFGVSIAITTVNQIKTIFIGADSEDTDSKGDNGQVHIFTQSTENGYFYDVEQLSGTQNNAYFGNAIAAYENSVVIGSHGYDNWDGAVYLYQFLQFSENGGTCTQNKDCLSDSCVDGICCNTSCRGTCETCQAPNQLGTCVARTAKENYVCRAAIDSCDAAEVCDGTGTYCPPDTVKPANTLCREATSACDIAEVCDGSAKECPTDAVKASQTLCRESAGDCDIAEVCNGSAKECPIDAVQSNDKICRAVSDICDLAETCDGTHVDCPVDQFEPSSFICRDSSHSNDPAEHCTGNNSACPPDIKAPNPPTDNSNNNNTNSQGSSLTKKSGCQCNSTQSPQQWAQSMIMMGIVYFVLRKIHGMQKRLS